MDAVLLGGDTIDFPSKANINYLQECLSDLSVPYMYVNGYHDWTDPWEYMTDYGKSEYLPLLEPLMQGNTAIQKVEFEDFTINKGNLEQFGGPWRR